MSTAEFKQTDFFKELLAHNALVFKEITLSSGRKSSYYVDFRILLSHKPLTDYIINQFAKVLDIMTATGKTYQRLAGVAMAGVPWATLVSNRVEMPVFFVRPQAKEHGAKSSFDGEVPEFDDNIILIEDVLSSGQSVIDAITKLKNRGVNVTRVLSILDRNEGAREHIKYYFPEVEVTSLFQIDTLISSLHNTQLITDYNAEQVEFYRESAYTEMIKRITRLNEETKAEWDYIKDSVAWQSKYYPAIWNIRPMGTNNTLFLKLTQLTDWQAIKYKLTTLAPLGLRHVILNPDVLLTATIQQELLNLQVEHGFTIIYEHPGYGCLPAVAYTGHLSGHMLPMLEYDLDCNYISGSLANGMILPVYCADGTDATLCETIFNEIQLLSITPTFIRYNIHQILLKFIGPGVSKLMKDEAFWKAFRDRLLANIGNTTLELKGLIFSFKQLSTGDVLPAKLKLGRLVPLLLDTDEFYLSEDIVKGQVGPDIQEKVNHLTKTYMQNGFTHIVVGEDMAESNIPIAEKFGHYLKFMAQFQNKVLNCETMKASPVYTIEKKWLHTTSSSADEAHTDNSFTGYIHNTVIGLYKQLQSMLPGFVGVNAQVSKKKK